MVVEQSNHHPQIGIVGAGVSGMAAAWELSRQGVPSMVIEKSRGVSGRAATRSHGACRFDHGANYFKLEDPRVTRLVRDQLPTDELVSIPGDVRVFDGDGNIHPGDPSHNSATKWNYRHGISTLGKLLEAGAPLARVVRSTRIVKLEGHEGAWACLDEDGKTFGPFEKILITLPAPQAAELLDASVATRDLAPLLSGCTYHRQFTFVFGYDRRIMNERDYHALVNPDRRHAISWLSFEEDKPGHVPEDESVLVVQMSPDWSMDRFENDRASLVEEAAEEAARLLGETLEPPAWWSSQRWKYAHPRSALDPDLLAEARRRSLDFAGDSLVGKGRVGKALHTGLEAADRLAHPPA
ncbi:NAD(P)/FAD-dependent oxidoreductase [Haloferula sp. A504]|uniref:NAD(P)/FAD-dependent oxidoreductase n=1 Tax=Haloferula sp. A504 TaxID=3373601 RepID=UPI0031BF29D0|nr:FAD-dependent oxidoreductase [Verrucomicrobiaceae bacterium E54]